MARHRDREQRRQQWPQRREHQESLNGSHHRRSKKFAYGRQRGEVGAGDIPTPGPNNLAG